MHSQTSITQTPMLQNVQYDLKYHRQGGGRAPYQPLRRQLNSISIITPYQFQQSSLIIVTRLTEDEVRALLIPLLAPGDRLDIMSWQAPSNPSPQLACWLAMLP